MLNLTNIPKDRSGYGSRLRVIDVQKSVEIEYKLVSSEEADVEQGLISTTSPIGRALLNRKVGDEVTGANSSREERIRNRSTRSLFSRRKLTESHRPACGEVLCSIGELVQLLVS